MFSGCEFHKKWHSGSHILRKGVKGRLSYFPHLFFDLGEAGFKRSAQWGRVVGRPGQQSPRGGKMKILSDEM